MLLSNRSSASGATVERSLLGSAPAVPSAFLRLEQLAQQIADCAIDALDLSSTDTGDIMLSIRER
ncbi:hypothetical protein [Actinomyces capricornis]|uniref:Uncharacterized protein n=1 Tax=Actinomyces capricornis TaxID=2755559 RepID=A0ABM7UBG8_9ACTO|nr:hypothetical protein [Actinomyces capricornis]BDA64631.1 hypothetical protein MANAM107_14650 [Actinomyces capricornis]